MQSSPSTDKRRFVDKATSDLLTYMGQFFDHDLDKTMDGEAGDDAPIPVPRGDPYYDPLETGNKTMPFRRSAYNKASSSPYRQSINAITAFLDGSVVYGSKENTSNALRVGWGGRLRVEESAEGLGSLPPLVAALDIEPERSRDLMSNDAGRVPLRLLRALGDVRGNVNPPILALQTLWMREHNRLAGELAAAHPGWEDEVLFQEARRWTVAYLQRVCFYEYVPALGLTLRAYAGYNASVHPGIDAFFATVAYRYGHSEVTDVILRVDDEGSEVPQGHLLLHTAYFNPNASLSAGIDPILRGLTMRVQGYVEPRFAPSIQHFLFGMPGVNGTDLVARNIQRGRDHGIPDYTACRRGLGLEPLGSFEEVTDDPALAATLRDLYGSPDRCDAYVCGLAERKLSPGAHFGQLFAASLAEQYTRVRDGDWYYFENPLLPNAFSEAELNKIKSTSFRDIILRNTKAQVLPENIWHVDLQSPWPPPTCAAGGGGASGSGSGSGGITASPSPAASTAQRPRVSLAGGRYVLSWTFVDGGGAGDMVEFTVTAQTSGWLGLGVAADVGAGMAGADIVMGRVGGDGGAEAWDMWASGFQAPGRDETLGCGSHVQLVSGSRTGGSTTLTFRRLLAAADRCDRALARGGRAHLIYAFNTDTDDMTQYHGANRGRVSLTLVTEADASSLTGGGDSSLLGVTELAGAAGHTGALRSHGVLMAVAFCICLPLGALCGKLKNAAFLSERAVHACFYGHVLSNLSGAVMAAAGFGLIFRRLPSLDYVAVGLSHGTFGVAIMALLFLQVSYPWVRPAPLPLTRLRRAWELGHSLLGRSVMVMGLVNTAIGIHLIIKLYAMDASFFILLAGVPVAALTVIGSTVDRYSMQAAKVLTLKMAHSSDQHSQFLAHADKAAAAAAAAAAGMGPGQPQSQPPTPTHGHSHSHVQTLAGPHVPPQAHVQAHEGPQGPTQALLQGDQVVKQSACLGPAS
ncbi:hypothetical protein HYH03_013285 [Edaphochlamys debaryana]|uniref:Uncharacterized protein n=1 Tax=Edaphochlamys debaryana TaxID=47281 RepID=A0A836BTB0_9CHLO|nr:hypothetical protein HYH03_013285 [Edaphochlamys debaryana]|eukprot:KAG2488140.1 hypothetical protein HYH03_013285 [Edaphochlamys debaryana]